MLMCFGRAERLIKMCSVKSSTNVNRYICGKLMSDNIANFNISVAMYTEVNLIQKCTYIHVHIFFLINQDVLFTWSIICKTMFGMVVCVCV